jgi:hypothetical protein
LEARNVRGYRFSVPFDPHTVADFDCDENFYLQYNSALTNLPKGVTVDTKKGLHFFQTKEDYTCEYFEAL